MLSYGIGATNAAFQPLSVHRELRRGNQWSLKSHSALTDPFVFAASNALGISRVSDSWPPPGLQKREPLLEHIRDVWTLHWMQSNCIEAIWQNDFGLELRVEHGGELIESRLSGFGEEPLSLIANQIRTNLIAQGWFEPTDATH